MNDILKELSLIGIVPVIKIDDAKGAGSVLLGSLANNKNKQDSEAPLARGAEIPWEERI